MTWRCGLPGQSPLEDTAATRHLQAAAPEAGGREEGVPASAEVSKPPEYDSKLLPWSLVLFWNSLVAVEPSGEGDEACCAVQACGPRTVSWCWLRVAPLFPCPCQPGCLYIPSASSSELAPGLAARLSRNRCCRSEPGFRPGQGPRPPAGRSQAWPATSPSAALRSPRTLVLLQAHRDGSASPWLCGLALTPGPGVPRPPGRWPW